MCSRRSWPSTAAADSLFPGNFKADRNGSGRMPCRPSALAWENVRPALRSLRLRNLFRRFVSSAAGVPNCAAVGSFYGGGNAPCAVTCAKGRGGGLSLRVCVYSTGRRRRPSSAAASCRQRAGIEASLTTKRGSGPSVDRRSGTRFLRGSCVSFLQPRLRLWVSAVPRERGGTQPPSSYTPPESTCALRGLVPVLVGARFLLLSMTARRHPRLPRMLPRTLHSGPTLLRTAGVRAERLLALCCCFKS